MAVELLIDGYNLLHHAGLGRRAYRPGEFERARDKLLNRLKAGLTEAERLQTTIIFDAQYAETSDRRSLHRHGMTVLFSPRGRQADDVIEMLLAGHPQPRNVLVISSDHRLQRAARQARAEFIGCDGFLCDLDDRQERRGSEPSPVPEQSPAPQTSSAANDADVDSWLKEFGEIDVASIRNEDLPSPVSGPSQRQPPTKVGHNVPAAPRTNSTPPTPEDPEEGHPPQPAIPVEDLSFWEQRIAELLKTEEFDSKRPRRR